MADTKEKKLSFLSPFRYPGGKSWLIPTIRKWLRSKPTPPVCFVEPFCGGASAGLTVANEHLARIVILAEIDPKVAVVWKVVIDGTDDEVTSLINAVLHFDPSRENTIFTLEQSYVSDSDRAFQTILRNRVTHGGGLAQGVGLLKNGEDNKGLRSRWYPETLVRRIKHIRTIKDHLCFQQDDAFQVLRNQLAENSNQTTYFIDPPYVVNGSRLYDFSEIDHGSLFSLVSELNGDVLFTYDDVELIRNLAHQHDLQIRTIKMRNKNHQDKDELLIARDLGWFD